MQFKKKSKNTHSFNLLMFILVFEDFKKKKIVKITKYILVEFGHEYTQKKNRLNFREHEKCSSESENIEIEKILCPVGKNITILYTYHFNALS